MGEADKFQSYLSLSGEVAVNNIATKADPELVPCIGAIINADAAHPHSKACAASILAARYGLHILPAFMVDQVEGLDDLTSVGDRMEVEIALWAKKGEALKTFEQTGLPR